MKKIIYYFAFASILILGLSSCNNDTDEIEFDTSNSVQETQGIESFDKKIGKKGDKSIAAIAIASEDFNQLVAALAYVDAELDAGLVDLFLNGKDQFTVFAPTDTAFQNLYDALGDDVNAITDLPADLVLNVLLYHVAEGRRGSNSVVPKNGLKTIETLLGESFTVDSDLMIETFTGKSSTIEAADISASNGIIHIVNAVILPI